jgi:hypothetical protein
VAHPCVSPFQSWRRSVHRGTPVRNSGGPAEHEDLYDGQLDPIGANDNHPGDVGGFAPPGDIHRIRNTRAQIAISLHIYGSDITRTGSSARRYYS